MGTLLLLCVLGASLSCPSFAEPVGSEFVLSFMQNWIQRYHEPNHRLFITAVQANTKVTVSVPPLKFKQEKTLNAGEGVTVSLPAQVEIYGSVKSPNSVRVEASADVAVTSFNYKLYTADTSLVYPTTEWGNEYFIFTPTGSPCTTFKEFSVTNGKQRNRITILTQGGILFQHHPFKKGAQMIIDLEPYESVQLQSTDDLSGSIVSSQYPVAVFTGHSCTRRFSKCDHVYEQLLPVSSWGSSFMVPPMKAQQKFDSVFIQASQPTRVTVQNGKRKQVINMVRGQTVDIECQQSEAVFIQADQGIQVLMLFNGKTIGWSKSYDPFLMTILSTDRLCTSYSLEALKDFDSEAPIVAQTSAIAELRIDGTSLSRNVQWKNVAGTDFSWTQISFKQVPGNNRHTVSSTGSPFALYSTGFSDRHSYGTPAQCLQPVRTPGTCWARGDPHYHTFDGRRYNFMGTCTYVIAKNCGRHDFPAFEVLAQNENRGSLRVSYVAMVTVKVYGVSITVARSEKGRVRIDNIIWNLPVTLNNNKLVLSRSGRFVVIETDFGLTVRYDWNHQLVVTLSSIFAGKTCGLCGNFNGNPSDDFITPSGKQAPGAVAFGGSWKVSGLKNDALCRDDCVGGCESCEHNLMTVWEGNSFCGLITQVNGPFSKCHSTIDPQAYLENCKYDVCMGGGLPQFLCQALEAYADACQSAGIQVQDWREKAKCPAKCPPNSHYEVCGDACPVTCSDPKAPSKCKRPCLETCTCNPGFVLSGDQCVPASQCGCTYEGRYVPAGESFWADQTCGRWCTCIPGKRQVECQDKSCDAGTLCQVVEGIRKCQPTSYSTCKASGDPHYTTFDKKKFDFQGACVYQLVGVCSRNPELVPFEVLVEDEHRGSKAVSFAKLVEIKVYSLSIVITKTHKGLIKVNNELVNLPTDLAEGQVSVSKRGSSAVVTTNFGLKVYFDRRSVVIVTLPSNYMGTVCGLCGNYNGNPEDDLTPKNGDRVVKPAVFGYSWHVGLIPGCAEP